MALRVPEPMDFRFHTHRICIVDDDAAIRDSMRALLESCGYEVQTFESATAFLNAPMAYCCLILDYRMPVTDGLALLELLRSGGIETPAILMTDKHEPILAKRIGAATARPLIKPITEARLIRSLEAICGGRCYAVVS
jgi:FixJ family two-component response regulator